MDESKTDLDSRFPGGIQATTGDAASGALALAFATIERPHVAQRLIVSARRCFPRMPIYVADQSLSVAAMKSFYAKMNVTLIRMPYDAGVCASRNRLVARITEKYFVLCDDDFVFGRRTNFHEALGILDHYPEIGVVGGKLYDYDGSMEYTRNWELFLHLDRANRTLTSIPIYHLAPRVTQLGKTQFYHCDAVMNFAVIRRDIFRQPEIRWDERFKSNGEHEDFFLNMKLNSEVRVAYLPTMVAYHHHPEVFLKYRSQLRDRQEGWKRFFAKWNIDQHLEIGLGVRTIDDFNVVVAEEEARDRFFLNQNLALRRETNAAALLVGVGSSLTVVGMLDKDGEPHASSHPTARLLVGRVGSGVIPAPDREASNGVTGSQGPLGAESCETAKSRYSFVPHSPVRDWNFADVAVLFRYNPIARGDADFVLWYRVVAATDGIYAARQNASGAFAVHVRWFAADGRVLMWASGRNLVDLARTDYWVPLLVEVPVHPNGCAFMRFEVVAGEGGARRHLGTGYLFSALASAAVATPSRLPIELDVLALTPWKVPSAPIMPPANLMVINAGRSDGLITSRRCAEAPGLMLIPIGDLADIEILFLFGWEGLGAPLLIIDDPRAMFTGIDIMAPIQIALPWQAEHSVRIASFSTIRGYRQVPLHVESESCITSG
ncbi:MAG: glycosyltransferase family 2 protein [Steroidobacteraceae bacterium]